MSNTILKSYINGEWVPTVVGARGPQGFTGNFSVATSEFANDLNTCLLLHMNGSNNGTIFTDDNS